MNSSDIQRVRKAALKRWRKGYKLQRDCEAMRKGQLMARALIEIRVEDHRRVA